MKVLQCELCGSNDLLKQDGVFVCQYCGTKYTLEEARKMMIDGTVSVTGTVQIDNSGKSANLIRLAREAFTDMRFESAYTLCNDALAIEPDNTELVAMHGLSVLGKEDFVLDIPASTTNSLNRFFTVMEARNGEFADRLSLFNQIENCINAVCKFKLDDYALKCRELASQKRELEITVEQADASLRWSMALGSTGDTNVANSVYAKAKEDTHHNEMMDKEINKLRAKADKVRAFQQNSLKTLSKMRIAQYWEANTDKKAAIDNEIKELESIISDLQAQMENAPCNKEISDIDAKVKALNEQYDKLGLFKIKEKKAIENEIEALRSERRKFSETNNAYQEEISRKMYPHRSRIRQLQDELKTDHRE